MVAIRRVDCAVGESHFVTYPVCDEKRPELEALAQQLEVGDSPEETAYFVVHLHVD